jgi:hypothetical protein
MKRSLFLVGVVGVAGVALTAIGPRAVFAAPGSARLRIVRRARVRRTAAAGSCADSRRKARWSGFTAADFA